MIGKKKDGIPEIVQQWEAFKSNPDETPVPDVPFQLLASVDASPKVWREIARNARWQMTRMNLNTFKRHGVFDDEELTRIIAQRLACPELIRKARVFPYQLLVAYYQSQDAPMAIRNALQTAMEIAIENTSQIEGRVWVFPDVSGSMRQPVTGYRQGSTSLVRCVDVAALVSASVLRRNENARVLPFCTRPHLCDINPRDSVMTNTKRLTGYCGGGTSCSVPLECLNKLGEAADLVIYVSDNESWADSSLWRSGTSKMVEWEKFKQRNPKAKMVCMDLQPNTHTQAQDRDDILNVGGFSDQVFDVISEFASGDFGPQSWVDKIEAIKV
jgi:60 kDa SS-A/Ro ribonucleoprotein